MSDSLWPHGLESTSLLCLWDFPGKNNGVGCPFLLSRASGRFFTTEPHEKPTRVIRGFQRVCFHDWLYFLPNFSLTSEACLCVEITQVMGNQDLEAGTKKRERVSMWEKGHQCWKQTHLSWYPGSITDMTMWAWATYFMSLNINSFYKIRVKERKVVTRIHMKAPRMVTGPKQAATNCSCFLSDICPKAGDRRKTNYNLSIFPVELSPWLRESWVRMVSSQSNKEEAWLVSR